MNAWDLIKHIIANAGSGSGRAGRREYAIVFCLAFIWVGAAHATELYVADAFDGNLRKILYGILIAGGLPLSVAFYSVTARRYHDFGWSGWWVFAPFLPLLLAWPGAREINAHGAPPNAVSGPYSVGKGRTLAQAIQEGLNSVSWLS